MVGFYIFVFGFLRIVDFFIKRDIIKIFTDAGIGTERGFVDAINNYDYAQYFDFVRVIDENKREGRIFRLEGYLYPDTYDFYCYDSKECAELAGEGVYFVVPEYAGFGTAIGAALVDGKACKKI